MSNQALQSMLNMYIEAIVDITMAKFNMLTTYSKTKMLLCQAWS